jgi:hypothetical protein
MVGYHASMLGDMQTGVGAVALINSPGDALQFTRYALDLLRAVREDRTLPPLPDAMRPTRVANASDYAGTFDGPGRSLSLRADGERLLLETGATAVALESRGADAFFVGHPDFERFLLRFGRQEGRVVEAFHGGDWYANSAYAGPRAFDVPPEWRAYPGHYRSHNPWMTSLRVVLRKGRLRTRPRAPRRWHVPR